MKKKGAVLVLDPSPSFCKQFAQKLKERVQANLFFVNSNEELKKLDIHIEVALVLLDVAFINFFGELQRCFPKARFLGIFNTEREKKLLLKEKIDVVPKEARILSRIVAVALLTQNE